MRSKLVGFLLILVMLPLTPALAGHAAPTWCDAFSPSGIVHGGVWFTRVSTPPGVSASAESQPDHDQADLALGVELATGEDITIAAAGYGGLAWRLVVAEGPMVGAVVASGALGPEPGAHPLATVAAPGSRLCLEAAVPTEGAVVSAAYEVVLVRHTAPALPLDPAQLLEDLVPTSPPDEACVTLVQEADETRVCAPPAA